MIRIDISDLKVGVPVPYNVYDESGKLLIKKGLMLESDSEIDNLVKNGFYIRDNAENGFANTSHLNKDQELVLTSAMAILSRELRTLDNLLKIVRGKVQHPDIQSAFLASAHNLYKVVDQHRDICLASILFNKTVDNYPLRHSFDTAIIAIIIGLFTDRNIEEILSIIAASFTMNVSMLQLQDKLLTKQEQLSQNERDKIARHPIASRQLLEQAGITDTDWLDYVLYHHEKMDGNGYPHGLQESAIPEGAKIISLADRYTALTTPRAYRPSVFPNQVLRRLLINEGNTVDLRHIGVLTKIIGIYPPGMFVRLRNGEIAVVISGGGDGACPMVKSLLDANSNPLPFPVARNTSEGLTRITGSVFLPPEEIPFDMVKIWGED